MKASGNWEESTREGERGKGSAKMKRWKVEEGPLDGKPPGK